MKLKPCPFCGCNETELRHDDGIFWVKCLTCEATGPTNTKYDGEEGDPYVSWDTRFAEDK